MKINKFGVILALKNIGIWLGSYTVSGIKTDPYSFAFAFLIYVCVSVPSDLLLLNHATSEAKKT
jgi:hypothetical protein